MKTYIYTWSVGVKFFCYLVQMYIVFFFVTLSKGILFIYIFFFVENLTLIIRKLPSSWLATQNQLIKNILVWLIRNQLFLHLKISQNRTTKATILLAISSENFSLTFALTILRNPSSAILPPPHSYVFTGLIATIRLVHSTP